MKAINTSLQYRAEIDGLRAMAVIPVILFHAGVEQFSGGYIGVDVFFVISGYLITAILLRQKEKGRFSLRKFYENRARRIFPALIVMLLTVSITAWLFMTPSQLSDYHQSLVAVILFSSNIYFGLNRDYFSPPSEELPLLHTWSLAVEEQFYIVFPLMLMLLWLTGRRRVWNYLALLATVSLVSAEWSSTVSTQGNFYLLPGRAWELLCGSILGCYHKCFPVYSIQGKKYWAELLAVIGLFFLLLPVFVFDENTPFPGVYTLVPVAGTMLIIIFASEKNVIGNLLRMKFLVFIGLISYSLYLWHQPIFAYLRIGTNIISLKYKLSAAALLIVLSVLSWKFIEQPFRYNKTGYSGRLLTTGYLFVSIIVVIIALVGMRNNNFQDFFPYTHTDLYQSMSYSPKRAECHSIPEPYLHPDNACRYFGENITWAVIGDSLTVEMAYALAEKLEPQNEGLLHLSMSGCAPALSFPVRHKSCNIWLKQAIAEIKNNPSIKNILVGFSYSTYLHYQEGNQLKVSKSFKEDLKLGDREVETLYWQSFEDILSELAGESVRIYVMYPIPMPTQSMDKLIKIYEETNEPETFIEHAIPLGQHVWKNAFILGKMHTLNWGGNLIAVDPAKVLCDKKLCYAVKDGKAMYFDHYHLSVAGASLVVDQFY